MFMDEVFCSISDPRVSAVKRGDPDMLSFNEAVQGEFLEQFVEAIPQSEAANVIRSTWAFKLKRLPDGTTCNVKTRFCLRGDLQKEIVEYFETYAPLVSWYTIRTLL